LTGLDTKLQSGEGKIGRGKRVAFRRESEDGKKEGWGFKRTAGGDNLRRKFEKM